MELLKGAITAQTSYTRLVTILFVQISMTETHIK